MTFLEFIGEHEATILGRRWVWLESRKKTPIITPEGEQEHSGEQIVLRLAENNTTLNEHEIGAAIGYAAWHAKKFKDANNARVGYRVAMNDEIQRNPKQENTTPHIHVAFPPRAERLVPLVHRTEEDKQGIFQAHQDRYSE